MTTLLSDDHDKTDSLSLSKQSLLQFERLGLDIRYGMYHRHRTWLLLSRWTVAGEFFAKSQSPVVKNSHRTSSLTQPSKKLLRLEY